jgi:hypothetical protein
VQALDEGLADCSGEVPGEELTSVGVAGNLQVEVRLRGLVQRSGLMRKEDLDVDSRGACYGRVRIGRMMGDELPPTRIGHPGEQDLPTIVCEDPMFVHQDIKTHPLGFLDPRLCS